MNDIKIKNFEQDLSDVINKHIKDTRTSEIIYTLDNFSFQLKLQTLEVLKND